MFIKPSGRAIVLLAYWLAMQSHKVMDYSSTHQRIINCSQWHKGKSLSPVTDEVMYNRDDVVKERSPKVRQINLCFLLKAVPPQRINFPQYSFVHWRHTSMCVLHALLPNRLDLQTLVTRFKTVKQKVPLQTLLFIKRKISYSGKTSINGINKTTKLKSSKSCEKRDWKTAILWVWGCTEE